MLAISVSSFSFLIMRNSILGKNSSGKTPLEKLLWENSSGKILLPNTLRNYGRHQANHMKYY